MSKSCGCNKRVISNTICNSNGNGTCHDVCVEPQCGTPEFLTVLAPVVYDEIGINVCRSIELPSDLLNEFPTAAYASAEVIDIDVSNTCNPTSIRPINSRPNCYEVTLTNLSVTFALRLYDCCKKLLTTATLCDVIYLPESHRHCGYNPDTNPSSVTLELFAPYGVSYTNGDIDSPELNYIGFSSTNNTITQGLNLMSVPKVLNFDIADGTITVGLTLVVKTIYFTQYQIPHNGRPVISKGTLAPEDESLCMTFVSGSLLDRNIKPLESCNPLDNKESCNSCTDPCDCACLTPDE
ncbi:MAG: hypothetical protein K2G45_01945 [Lachnospiraceae bacterium]|nr:hypothetical protein [Lachnospiraceae bacterium]